MARIHLLNDALISKIAAGEVVERPASVVKELVENALDAGATEIRLDLEAGGKRRILIVDDGSGMDRDDALLAFDRHATSKISDFNDLEHVVTLGFRGEALATIAAVARVEMITAEEPGDGHRVRIEGGRVKVAEPAPHPRGTRIEVASLFFNVPARRKFLKRPQTELRRAVEVVQGYALAHPQVRFTLRHEGRTLLETLPVQEGEEGLAERIGQVFGRSLTRNLIALPPGFETGEELITGFVGNRETSRGRRTFIYVNRRLIRDRAILARFYGAVREAWKSEEFPALFLFLDVPPEDVDVNVHPQKAEVRFRRNDFVDRVSEALRAALAVTRGEEPAPLRLPSAPPRVPAMWEGLGSRKRLPPEPSPDRWQRISEVREGEPAGPYQHTTGENRLLEPGDEPATSGSSSAPATEAGPDESSEPRSAASGHIARPTFEPLPARRPIPLSGRSGEEQPFRLLGQYKGTLILLEGPDGLYLIDQHVAHERILYERVRRSMERERPLSQTLLTPPLLELSTAEAMRLSELAPALEACGFSLTPMSGQAIALTAVPTPLGLDEAESLLRQLASTSSESDSEVKSLRRRLLDALAASLACRAAVKMHHKLSAEEMESVISELFQAEQPYACPHGRPTVLQMSDIELERRFGRR